MNHPDHLKEYIAGIVLITIILVFATQLDTITGMATSTSGTNTSLSISDDSDTATVYQGELMTFIANYTNLTGTAINNASDNGTCLIQFHDSARAVEMAYNLTTYLYTYSRTLPESGTFSWNVSCVSDLYETLALQETASIADTFCGMVVQGSITLSQDIETAGGATPCSGDGLEIVADDVIIDCAGHTIGGSQSDDGITASGRSNITVINCTIADFARGIYFTSTDESRVYFNTFTGNALHAYSDSADNDFNTTVAGEPWGNSWDDVPRLAIFDSDSDGYGDSGYQYPYNSSHSSKVVGITDWGPVASAVDSDNDGSPDTEDCAPADPTTFAPRDDILVTQDSSLCAGTYYLNDSLYSGIIRFASPGLTLDCNGAVLIGNTSGTGIYTGKTNTTVLGCDVRDFYHGAYLWRGNHSRISDFYAEGNSYAGLTLHNSSFVNITDATVTDNSNAGIFLTTYSGNNNLSGIDAYDNYIGIYSYYSHNNTMKDIECYDNTWYGLDLERSDDNDLIDIMHHNNLKGLYLSYSHRNDLVNISSFNNSGSGILLWFSETNHLRNVSSSNNDESGLVIWTARNNLVENMTIDSNGVHGIYSYMSLRARIFNNTLTGNSLSGICINRSDSNVLKDNNITGNYRGVCASGSYGTVIEQNDIIGSTTSGVFGGPDGTLAILNNTISGGTGCGVNVSGADINLTANTISSNSLDGVWVQDADLANISSNSVSGNGGFGLFYINSTFLPSAPLSANTVSTDNTFGMLSFNWYVEIRTFDRTGSDQANASVNVTVVGDAAPQHVTVTDAGFTTPRLIMTEYMIDNSVSRVNRSYTIYAVYGGFAGTNSSNVTQHLLDADGNAVTVTLSTALPPSVTLVSPAHNTSTTDHNPVFVCNASHEGGLANITLYHSNSGNWTAVKTNNVSGIANQTSFTVPVSDGSFNWSCLAKGLFENSGFGSNFTLRVYTVVTDTGGTGGGGDTPPPDEPPPEPPPPEPPPPEPPPPEPPPDEPPPEPPGEPETETPAESAAPAEGSAESDKEALEVVDIAEAVSCEEKIVIKEEDISLDELKNLIELPPGYIIVGKPFKADCAGGETFSTSLLLPDNLEDVQVIQCAVGSCASKTTRYVNRMCPGEEVELVREEDEFDMSSMTVNMTPVASKLSAGNRSLKSGDYEVDVGGEEDVEVSMGVAAGVQKEPANRNVRIVGAPVELKVAGVTDSVEVTLPFSVGEGEDASSVAVYAKRIEGNTTRWLYIGGQIDLVKRVVEAKVNLSQYAETGSVTLAPITIHCPECGGEADFRNVFTPARDSRQAIILLHGLWGVGKVWDSMVDEFRLTRQPYQLWTYSYLVSNPLERSGLDLANYLEANSYRYDSIYIVGYSLGGLVAQSALRQAYDMREQGIADYSFLDDVRKVLLVANPSEGSPVADYADIFLTESVNSEDSAVLPMNSIVKDVLSEGYVSEPVPGMSYYAIAGTKSYGFMDRLGLTERLFEGQPNDGVVAVRSAQRLGNNYLDRDCVNYWSQPVDHTHLIEDRLVQKIMGQIISRDLFEAAGEEDQKVSLFGYSNYYEVEIEDCSPDRLYFVIGVEKEEEKVERVAYCACGNGVCDGLENAKTCPDDCRLVAKPLVTRIVEHSLEILALLIALFMVFGFFFAIYEHYKKKKKKEEQLPPGFNILEGKSMPAERLTYVRTGLVGLGKRMVMFIRLPHIMLRKTGEGNGWSESHRESAAEKKERKRREVLRSKIRLHTERIKMRLAGSRSKGSRKSVKGTPKKKGRHKAGKKKSRTHEPGKNRAAKHKAVKHRPRKSAPKKHKVRQQRPGHSKQKHGTGKPKKQNTHRTGAGNFQKPYK